MQKVYYSDKTNAKIRAKFRNHHRLYGKYAPRFPVSAEREYIRYMNSYMKSIKNVLEEEMPKFSKEYQAQIEDYKLVHQDGIFDFDSFVDDFFNGIAGRLSEMGIFGANIKLLRQLGLITKRVEIREWKLMVHKTLGLNLSEDYYRGSIFDDILNDWVIENVDLIVTIPNRMLGRMKQTVKSGYEQGMLTGDIAKKIMKDYDITKGHAQFIARDQMAKLSANITQREHEDAGVEKYVWSTSGDERVRTSHRELDGKVFSYDDPPETDGGRHCNPGEDYNCRCVAIPIFEEPNMSLPLEDNQ